MDAEVVLRPLADPGWATFVAGHPDALPFHHPAWAAMLAECYGFRGRCLTVQDPDGTIRAGLPVVEVGRRRPRWVSLPFTDTCPPLATGDLDLAPLLDEARRAHGIRRLEVRAALAGTRHEGLFLTHELALDRPEADIFASLHANQVRRNIRRAERAGVVVRTGRSEEDLTGVFYRLHTRTRHRLGVPVQPRRYFRLLWQRVIGPGLGTLLVAEAGGAPAAAAVFLAMGGTCVYKYGASDERLWGVRPNHLLFWEAIRWARACGCRTFDFGRTDLDDTGLREFKSRWGTVERELSYSVLSDQPAPGPAASAGAGGVPAPIRAFIRRGPRFVPRVVGELLYRYTA